MSKSVKVVRGTDGFGGPIILTPTKTRNKIVLVTGEKTNSVAEKISSITGATIIDGFSCGIPCEEILVSIVDCSGTARCGIYPKKGVKTINLFVAGDYGPLADYIVPDFYVSDVDCSCIEETTEVESDVREEAKPENKKENASCIYGFKPVLEEKLVIVKKNVAEDKKGLKGIFKGIFNK